ncbi:MAG: DUF3090 family protein [Chloroflexi bacterium]|nr:DUF3090 family protein [Chloroflexota bacterium]
MTILLLIRHASNDYVKQGRLAGWTPGVHLNAEGQREADALARRLAHLPIQAIYSSPLERAIDTARTVAACHRLDVEIRPQLGETQTGEWTGKLITELNGTETWKKLQSHPVGVHLPGGESIDEVQGRIVPAIDAIVAAHPNEIVAVVSHSDPLKAAIVHYLGMDLNQFQRLVISPASVTVFFMGEGGPVLFRLNDSDRLPALRAKPEKKQEASENGEERGKEEQTMPEANILYDLNPVTHITAGAVGEPGKRTFYLQGRRGATIVTLIAEKEQIAALSTGIDQLLERLGAGSRSVEVTATQMELSEPIEPVFRIGQLGLGYDAEQGLLVIVAYELPQQEEPPTVNVVRFWATKEQMRALARHAAGTVAAGRPICVLCGRPMDPQGHFCPRRNGHGEHAPLT